MGGRIYDPLAGRFTTADPILQAPFSSQGLNRYAYVFNDPINNTDPSGFDASGAGSGAGGLIAGLEGGGLANAGFQGIAAGLSTGAGIGLGGLGINSLITMTASPFGGSSAGSYSAAVPANAPNTSAVKPGGLNAVGQSRPPVQEGPEDVQDRADRIQDNLDNYATQLSHRRIAQSNPWAAAAAAEGVLLGDDVTGVGAADDLLIPVVLAGAAVLDATQRVFVTYVLTNPASGQVYLGRTSGFGDPRSIMERRYRTHFLLRAAGFSQRDVDVAAQGWFSNPAIRGREQQLMDAHGGVGDPGVANKIRGVSKQNPLGRFFHRQSDTYFGNIAPYTGY